MYVHIGLQTGVHPIRMQCEHALNLIQLSYTSAHDHALGLQCFNQGKEGGTSPKGICSIQAISISGRFSACTWEECLKMHSRISLQSTRQVGCSVRKECRGICGHCRQATPQYHQPMLTTCLKRLQEYAWNFHFELWRFLCTIQCQFRK